MKKSVNKENAKRIIYSVAVLVLCGATLFTFMRQTENNGDFIPEAETIVTKEITTEENIQVNTPVTNVPDERNSVTTTTQAILTVELAYPLNSTVTKEFSQNELVKNTTTDDWRIHKGIDIKGASGDRINAVEDGVVTELVHNAIWGTVVTVDHDNGFVAKYYGLRKGGTVQPGDSVSKNGKIGLLDEIPIEEKDGIHLHFELYRDGEAVSPSDYLGKSVDIL